jgi:F420-non-reducing hydrogenase small subunit
MAKIKVNTEWLSGCGGCHCAIVDIHDKLITVLGSLEIQHSPIFTDIKAYPPADVGIVTGAVRNEHDRAAAKKMRESCKLILALGTCSVYGGISGASLAHSREEILDRVYVHNKTTKGDVIPSTHVSPLEEVCQPVDEVIDVDLYLPGCPPHAAFVFDGLSTLLEKRSPKAGSDSVCGRCTRTMTKTDVDSVKSNHDGVPDPDVCFLSQGYVCLGSTSLDRCLSPCPNMGVPCTGCAGPTMQILTEPNRDIRTEIADRMSQLTKIPRASIVEAIEHAAKTHYAYAMATRMVGGKPTFLIKKWIADVEAGA